MRLPRVLALETALWTLALTAAASAAAAAVSAVESSAVTGWMPALAPLALAAATGLRFARARSAGAVDGWMALGGAPESLAAPLGLAAAVCGLALLLWGSPSSLFALPSPVPADATVWWTGEGWGAAPGARWRIEPGLLSFEELVSRWWEGPPPGARAHVDGAELLRRLNLALAWPIAVIAGTWTPLRSARRSAVASSAAALRGASVVGAWIAVGSLAAGAYSMT